MNKKKNKMKKQEVLNYMVTSEGYVNFFFDHIKDMQAINLEWDCVVDFLIKEGDVSDAASDRWKRPTIKEIEKAIEKIHGVRRLYGN